MKMIESVRTGGSKAVAEQMFPKMLTEKSVKQTPAVAQKLREIMENCSPKTIEQALLAMRDREDYTELLPSIAVPTLIIVGEEDPITPPSMAQGMHAAIGNSKLVKIANAAHLSTMERSKEVTDAIENFLSST
jgi:pimeloyl-ACP methyl ester carboxylesterase